MVSNNCLAGCVGQYAKGPKKEKFLRAPDSFVGHNMAPVVIVNIANGGKRITVGNDSAPTDNTAVIKSIEYGFIDSNEGKIEIVDEKGGELTSFLDSVQLCSNNFNVGAQIDYQIGWVYTSCGSNTGGIQLSPKLRGIILKISTNVSNGVIRFTIHFSTSHSVIQNLRQDQIFGEDVGGKTMSIEDAIQTLAAVPPAINVKYAEYDESGELVYLPKGHKWVNGTPKAAWHGDSQNKYSTIVKWLEGFRIDDGKEGKGAILIHDPTTPTDLVVLKDPQAGPGETWNPNLNVGTFIVNGGKCSNVLEFSPSFDFVSAMAHFSSGGGTSGGIKTDPVKTEDYKGEEEACHVKDTGKQVQATPTQSAERVNGKETTEETQKSMAAQDKASRLVSVAGLPIKAELRLVGVVDPEFHQIITGKSCGIVVISPFFIQNTKAGACGDFLKKADCHPFFSNSSWLILGVNHAVQEGSFVTTLSVMLTVGSIQIAPGEPLGANPSGYVNKVQ